MKKTMSVTVLSLSALILAGCAAPPASQSTYSRQDTGVAQTVSYGVVESVRPVVIDRGRTGIGTVGGAVVGGLLGNQIGKGSGRTAATVVGAVGGGVAGQAIEGRTSRADGVEITVRLNNGQVIAVTQAADVQFYPRDRVRVVSSNGQTRVTH